MDQTSFASERLFSEQRLRLAMAESDLSALVAHSSRNYYYVSGFTSLDYVIEPEAANFAVFARDGSSPVVTIPQSEQMALLADPIRSSGIVLTGSFYVEGYERPNVGRAATPREALVQVLRDLDAHRSRIGVESELLPMQTYRWLREQLPDAELVDGSEILRNLRMVKTSEEVNRIRRASQATDAAITDAVPAVRPGMTERDVGRLIARELVEHEVDPVYVQVAAGAAAGLCGPSDRVVANGDIIRADVAARFRGYHTDLGRTFAVGAPTQQHLDLYRASRRALEAAIAGVAPGASVASVFEAGLSAWHEAGYPKVQRHHIGHGIGLQPHEAPMITPGSAAVLTPGMVLALEIPYYVFEVGGFAPEDIVVVQDDGYERFTVAPEELPVA